jgi:hypothetical protein
LIDSLPMATVPSIRYGTLRLLAASAITEPMSFHCTVMGMVSRVLLLAGSFTVVAVVTSPTWYLPSSVILPVIERVVMAMPFGFCASRTTSRPMPVMLTLVTRPLTGVSLGGDGFSQATSSTDRQAARATWSRRDGRPPWRARSRRRRSRS